MKLFTKILAICTSVVLALVLILGVSIYFLTYHPSETQNEVVYNAPNAISAPLGKELKVLSWNIQYLAGKNYVFFYDLWAGDGKDDKPSKTDIDATLLETARVIKSENPDIILLQELDNNAERTYSENQLQRLLELIGSEYTSYSASYYWKAGFVPHPRVMGKVGMQLAVISKYKINSSIRHQLPLMPDNFIIQQFNFKRAILESHIALENNKELVVLTTHLDAFAQGNDTMEKQVAKTASILDSLDNAKLAWLISGDFNLLAPGRQYNDLPAGQQRYFKTESELAPFFTKYQAFPSLEQVNGDTRATFYSHFPNDPEAKGPDRTIDFIFSGKNSTISNGYIRNADTLKISDHLPLITYIKAYPDK